MNADQDIFDAVQANDLDQIRRLVGDNPALVRARNEQGLSIILFARYRFRTEALDILLGPKPPLDIFEAAAVGDGARVAELIAAQPQLVKAWSDDGFTALQLACFFGHPPAARTLIDHGADVNAVARNSFKVMALHSALAARAHDICELLIAHGADVNAPQQGGYTPLHEAAQHGDRRLVDLLLRHGARRDATKDDGQTPAGTAAAAGHAEIAELLRMGL